ncbi:MAG: family 78 glycoside hydrolase catalytic domain [Paracoccaceae bacterium]
MKPARFRVENLERSLMMDDSAPRFSWQVAAEGLNRSQSAWEIVVKERTSGSVVWDSERCSNSDTFGIVYDGRPLIPLTAYDCSLRIWDETGAVSGVLETTFEAGIMGADWPASWICVPPSKGAKPPEATLAYRNPFRSLNVSNFRKSFDLPGPVASARLHATALGHYRFFINGNRVGDDYLTPGFTDYHTRVEYSAYDVTGMLNNGANAIAALLGEGWYAGFIGLDMKRPGALYGRRPELSAFLTVTLENGKVFRLETDGSWTHFVGGLIYSDMLKGEKFDARMYPEGWDNVGFDDTEWEHAGQGNGADVRFIGAKAPPIRVTRKLAAKSVTQAPDGAWVFDMGQNMVGFSQATFATTRDQEVKLVHAEMLDAEGNLYIENLRSGVQEDTHVGVAGGIVTYAPTFVFHGFRFVGVYGLTEKPDMSMVEGIVLNNDLEETGSFECSNEILNQLHSNILWSQRGNFLSVPMDCPQRDERLGWTADGQVFAPTAAYNMDIQAFFTKWLDDIVDAQSDEGAFPDVAPRANSRNDGAPAWGDAGVILPLLLYQTYGDTRILDRMYQPMADWIAFIRRHNPNYIRENRNHNNYGDWLAIGQETPNNMVATAYYAWITRLMQEAATVRGNVEDAAYYGALAEAISEAFQSKWISEDGTIGSGSQSSYLIPLFCGVVPETLVPKAVEKLVSNIENAGRRLQLGFLGVRHLCPILSEYGHSELAYELATSTKLPSWGYSIVNGATTIWERWDGWTHENGFQVPNMNSFNHYAYGAIGEWMFGWMAGITPGAPGYRQIVLRPTPDKSMGYCRARYAAPVGSIGSEWCYEEGGIRYTFEVPASSTAELQLPCEIGTNVTVNGHPTDANAQNLYGGLRTSLKVGSGHYEVFVE